MNGEPAAGPPQTYTFLFTDMEGSTRLWEERPDEMRHALKRHDELVTAVLERRGGHVFKTVGDAVHAAFTDPTEALTSAVEAQIALRDAEWCFFSVRMALHSGLPERTADDYFGPPLNRTARIRDAGHGGQILVSEATRGLLADRMPPDCELLDLGLYRLKDLAEPYRIFQCVHPSLGREFPRLRTMDVQKHNLPIQTTSFIGRESEVEELCALLRDGGRCVSILGAGGCGKTRLSLQVGADLLDEFEDGVWFVPLVSITDPELVVSEVAQALNLKEAQGRTLLESVCDYLRDKTALLLFDNFEHVLAGVPVVSRILQHAPNVRALVTSREPLRIAGEQEWEIPTLGRADDSQLFIDRARLVKPSFAPSEEERGIVAEICGRLDSLPLAIELAAARTRILSPRQILDRLQDRLKLLTGGRRDAIAHHQTLRAAIDWSHNLLTDAERSLFAQLSVFAGGFSLEAAEAVCEAGGEVFDGLCSLREKSLLASETGDEEIRFSMLQTLREYAAERLAEGGFAEGLRRAHGEYYTAWAESQHADLHGEAQPEALDRVAKEIENCRAALDWADQAGADELAIRLTLALAQFWIIRGLCTEALGRTDHAIDAATRLQHVPYLGRLLNAKASTLHHRGEYAEAGFTYGEAVEVNRRSDNPGALAHSLSGSGWHASREGRRDEAYKLITEALELSRRIGDQSRTALCLCDLGGWAYHDGDYAEARRNFEEALQISRELGDRRAQSIHLQWLADVADVECDFGRARTLTLEALEIERALGNTRGVAWCLDQLAILALTTSEFAEARRLSDEALSIHREIDNKVGIAESLCRLAHVDRLQGRYDDAQARAEEALAVDNRLGDKAGIAADQAELGRIALALGDLQGAGKRLHEARAIYEEIGERKEFAETLCCLAQVSLHAGDLDQARALASQALTINRELGAKRGLLDNLMTLGRLAALRADVAEARRLFSEALDLVEELGDRLILARLADHVAELCTSRDRRDCAIALIAYADRVRGEINAPVPPLADRARKAAIEALRASVDDYDHRAEGGAALTPERIRTVILAEL